MTSAHVCLIYILYYRGVSWVSHYISHPELTNCCLIFRCVSFKQAPEKCHFINMLFLHLIFTSYHISCLYNTHSHERRCKPPSQLANLPRGGVRGPSQERAAGPSQQTPRGPLIAKRPGHAAEEQAAATHREDSRAVPTPKLALHPRRQPRTALGKKSPSRSTPMRPRSCSTHAQ